MQEIGRPCEICGNFEKTAYHCGIDKHVCPLCVEDWEDEQRWIAATEIAKTAQEVMKVEVSIVLGRVYQISFDDVGITVDVEAATFEIAVYRAIDKVCELHPGINLDGKISGRRVA